MNRASQPHMTGAVVDDQEDVPRPPVCPLCHTPAPLTMGALDSGADWRCVTCGLRWDAARLAVVAGYAAWVAERAAAIGTVPLGGKT